jgi:hypothetical protein
MVDRVYKQDLPKLGRALVQLQESFSQLDSTTDWTRLRVEPLLRHLESLERMMESREFSGEFSRLKKGVVLFHSDLEYFRTNVKGLTQLLQSEKERLARKGKRLRS